MKEGWEYKKLGEICRVINGRAYSKDEMLSQGKYRLLRVGNFFTNDSWYYSDLELEEDKYCDNGDLLYAWSASFGPRIWDGEKVIYHYHIWKMVCSPEIDKYFLCYWLDSDELKKQTMANLHGATMAHITKRIIENAIVSYPSLSEQKSIVDYLDSAFAKIDAMKANAEKALNEAKALFQASLKEMLEPKEGWEEKKLKEVVISITDGDHQPPPKAHDGIPFITISNIDKSSNKIVFEDTFYVPQSYFSALKKDRIPQNGDVLYTVTGSFGIPVLIDFQKEFCFQRHIALIRPNMVLLSPTYLFYWILSSYAISQAENTATGAAQRTVSLNSLRNFTIHVPPLSEQQSIVTTLDSLKSKVDRLQENYDKISQECDALKQAILRQVFE